MSVEAEKVRWERKGKTRGRWVLFTLEIVSYSEDEFS
jgi:hypothetical protein